jgi:hypothetical protein
MPAIDDTVRILYCLLDGEATVFQVKLQADDILLELKDVIHERGKIGTIFNVDSNNLSVWKVRLMYIPWIRNNVYVPFQAERS